MTTEFVLSSYKQALSVDATKLQDSFGITLLPHFEKETVQSMISEFQKVSSQEPTLLKLHGDFIIVGDIHGNIQDLIRILTIYGLPNKTSYVFLGDYVDRGDFSLEVIMLLMAMKCKYPNSVFMLRGNHEIDNINRNYGFYDQIMEFYNDSSIWESFNEAFQYLSMAATIDNDVFCVHGGISPYLTSLNDILSIDKPVTKTTKMIDDLLWSDPADCIPQYAENERGKGLMFGTLACSLFLHANNLKTIVRAHQCVEEGFKIRKNVITVFSSSYYASSCNHCAICKYVDNNLICEVLPTCLPLRRPNVSFYDVVIPKPTRLKHNFSCTVFPTSSKAFARPKTRNPFKDTIGRNKSLKNIYAPKVSKLLP